MEKTMNHRGRPGKQFLRKNQKKVLTFLTEVV